jgi:SanA protein
LAVYADLWVIISTDRYMYASAASVPQMEVALVLGASIKSDGELSPVLEERADAAIALYDAHKVTKILVSGDNSTFAHDEVYPVGKYLLHYGIPESDIFLDYAGFDTYSSMYRAKNIFGVTSMIISTQRFHLPRALYLARSLGIDAVGLDASAGNGYYMYNALREIPATAKSLMDLALHRQPRYLGPQFFVTGDGAATWVGPKAQMIYFSDEQ